MDFYKDIKSATSVALDHSKKDGNKGFFIYEMEDGFTVETDYRSGWVLRTFRGEVETPKDYFEA